MRKILAPIMIVLILAISSISFSQDMDIDPSLEFENFIERATVLEASEIMENENEAFPFQEVKLRIDSGERKGTEITIQNVITGQANYDIIVKQGAEGFYYARRV